MRESHSAVRLQNERLATTDSKSSGMRALLEYLERRREADAERITDFERLERELHALFVTAEREALSEELARLDINEPLVEVGGIVYRQVKRCEETYFSAAGPLRVERSLYSTRAHGERAICPLELRAGIVEGRWTPQAAKQATWVVAHLTPGEGEELFRRLGNMTPSKSSIDRLPKQLSNEGERQREEFEAKLRRQEVVPKEAATVAVSLDGVMIRIEGLKKQGDAKEKASEVSTKASPSAIEAVKEKRTKDDESEKKTSSRADRSKGEKKPVLDDGDEEEQNRNPYHEASCGTVALYDREGEMLSIVRLARMPEKRKSTLKSMLLAEVSSIIMARPDLAVEALADGAKDNWSFLSKELPAALPKGKKITEALDFFHGAEHLEEALSETYGKKSKKCSAQFQKLRHVLRHDEGGVETVIRSLRHLANKRPKTR
jgi:hypothetical protein